DLFLLRSLFRGGASKQDWLERWEFWNSALSRHNIDTSTLPGSSPSYSAAAIEVWKQYSKGALYGDKSPNYFDSMQRLSREFPNARFIVIWRDVADTCGSILRAAEGSTFFAKRGITHRALIGYRRMKDECDALVRGGIALHQVHYEEMVQSPAMVMQGICWFLQIPFEACMASLEGADRSAIYEAPQHVGVKSEKIGIRETRNAALPAKLRDKISRYVAYWKKDSAGAWPTYPASAGDAKPASILERTGDELYFRALRALDRFTAFAYCHAPISILRRYRASRDQRRAAGAPETAPLSQTSNGD
ncbi:MAG: sulfotransferase, partial [Candidatus Sulfotelmatobacter sp.]|nr:sulfotransferase [Candidatus Sulfotelmatobacter sp.]